MASCPFERAEVVSPNADNAGTSLLGRQLEDSSDTRLCSCVSRSLTPTTHRLSLASRLTSSTWSQVFQFALCIHSFTAFAFVSRNWHSQVNTASSWEGSIVDISTCVVPQDRMQQFSVLWSLADCFVLWFLNISLLDIFSKPSLILRTSWMVLDDAQQGDVWHNLFDHVFGCFWACMSQWPVFPKAAQKLKIGIGADRHGVRGGRHVPFALGFTAAQSLSQLARVATGEYMTLADESIHVCMLHFPAVFFSRALDTREKLSFQHVQGQVGTGFDMHRHVDTSSPFYDMDEFDIYVEMNFAMNEIYIQINDGATTRIPAFFLENGNVSAADESASSRWRFFIYVESSFRPLLVADYLDLTIRPCIFERSSDKLAHGHDALP